jgi:hypothetical protein
MSFIQRILFALTAVLLGTIQVALAQFSTVPNYTPPVSGTVSGTVTPLYTAAPAKSSAIKEALADAIVMRAEAHKEKVLAKHGSGAATEAAVPAAKTKNFAYTSIQIPGSSNTA